MVMLGKFHWLSTSWVFFIIFGLKFLIPSPCFSAKLPWPKNQRIRYQFITHPAQGKSQKIGESSFTIADTTIDFLPAYIIQENFWIQTPGLTQKSNSHLLMDHRGKPLGYKGFLILIFCVFCYWRMGHGVSLNLGTAICLNF